MDTPEKDGRAFLPDFSPGHTSAGVSNSCLYLSEKPIKGGPDWCAERKCWIEKCPENCPDKKPKEV